jgi:hypothetical protein
MVEVYPGRGGVGLRNVGSYQISGHPYMTGSTMKNGLERKVEFPFVTQEITIRTSGSNMAQGPTLRVHFNATGSNANVIPQHHYFTLGGNATAPTVAAAQAGNAPIGNGTLKLNVKCKEIYITCVSGGVASGPAAEALNGFQLFASLTNIGTGHMYELTGSGLTEQGPSPW